MLTRSMRSRGGQQTYIRRDVNQNFAHFFLSKNEKQKETKQNKTKQNRTKKKTETTTKNKIKENNNNNNKNLEGSNVIPFIISCSTFFIRIFNQSEFAIEKIYFKKVLVLTLAEVFSVCIYFLHTPDAHFP